MYDRRLNGSHAITLERTMRNSTFTDVEDDDDLDEDAELHAPVSCEAQVAEFIRRLMVDRAHAAGDGEADVRWSAPETADHPPLREGVVLDVNVDGCRYVLTRTVPKPAPAQELLSPREQEISRMIAKGYPNKTIASVLDISAWTVCTHLRRIFAKLGVSSRAAMVARLKDEYPHMFGNGLATE